MTTPSNPDAMNSLMRGRGRPVPTGQTDADAPADPLDQAKEIAAGLAGQIDTLRKLLIKASAADG